MAFSFLLCLEREGRRKRERGRERVSVGSIREAGLLSLVLDPCLPWCPTVWETSAILAQAGGGDTHMVL